MALARIRILLLLCLLLIAAPGCRLYEFLTGTGYYSAQPYMCPGCTTSLYLDGDELVLADEGMAGALSSDSYDSTQIEAEPSDNYAPEQGWDESDFGEPTPADPLQPPTEGVFSEPEFESDLLGEDPVVPESTEYSEPYEVEFADPQVPSEPQSTELEEPGSNLMEMEDPFPVETPESELPPPADPVESAPPAQLDPTQPSEDITPDDLFREDERPMEPESNQRDSLEMDEEDQVDQLELFDESVDPDLNFDSDLELLESSSFNDSNLPSNRYRDAIRPSADSFFGRCLPPPLEPRPKVALDGRRRQSKPPRRLLSDESIPTPGRALFDQPEVDSPTRRANFESRSPRR